MEGTSYGTVVGSSKYTHEQLAALEACYERNQAPGSGEVRALAQETGLTQAQCRAWLQYQRKKRKKHVLEHEREVFRVEIKCLNESIYSVKEQNSRLHLENEELRRSFEQMKEYEQEIDEATTTLRQGSSNLGEEAEATTADESETNRGDPAGASEGKDKSIEKAVMTLAGALTRRVEDIADKALVGKLEGATPDSRRHHVVEGSDQNTHTPLTADSNVSHQMQLRRITSTNRSKTQKSPEEAVQQICSEVGKELRDASKSISKALAKTQNPGEGSIRTQVVLHHPDTVNIRHVLAQRETLLCDELLRSVSNIVDSNEMSLEQKEEMLRPILQSHSRTLASIKEQQLHLKMRMLAHLPLVPHLEASAGTSSILEDPCQVRCTCMFCILCQCYLGHAERSLNIMGEASLSALLSQAVDYLYKTTQSISDSDKARVGLVLGEIRQAEGGLVKEFETKWDAPFELTRKHHDPKVASFLFQGAFRHCYLKSPGAPPGQKAMETLVSRFLSLSSQVHINGLKSMCDMLSPVLCGKLLIAMKEVKQLLVAADSFHEQVHKAEKVWE
ncbi:hypothetical protein HOP50_16g76720 [Chloropicon primus]|uniref:Homeobox domain-containing protein n=1 Tax=Chloropicon primus TaxID=1764295 RepID=A0A5B8MZN8_9CHLO|nr:hypothetical protein A3770_16p76430 [Chloropicon primus]UPR04334.1 hypothetical protein HOP50_16g76720 [Chloropicon primus]|eukprot:QDZ25125.1 hypothetical protein A3770_16p76430 [Chloropicon primus]